MRYLTLIAVVALIAAMGCSTESPTGVDAPEPAAKKTVKMVPFKASVIGGVLPGGPPDSDSNCLLRRLVASGEASHLGRYTIVGTHCMLLSDVLVWSQPGDIIRMDRGIMTWGSANGDELYGIYEAVAPLEVLDLVTGIAEGPVELTFVFTGGTGRFENVTGGGVGNGTAAAGEEGLTVEVEGEISSVGSSKGR